MHASDERHRAKAADRREIALVDVAEWTSWLTRDQSEDVLRRARSRLNRGGGDTGHGLAVRRHCRQIADDEDLRMIGHAQIRIHDDTSDPIEPRTELSSER